MKDIFVLVEHRQGEMRDVTLEMLSGAQALGGTVVAVLLGQGVDDFASKVAGYADKVLVVDDAMFANYNSAAYQKALSALIKEQSPGLIMMGHTGQGVDLAPALAVELGLPLVTDVTAMEMEGDKPKPTRTFYGGKLDAHMAMRDADAYMLTIREATFQAVEPSKSGEIVKVANPVTEEIAYRKFLEYVEAAIGEVDITQSAMLVGVGRGIREEEPPPYGGTGRGYGRGPVCLPRGCGCRLASLRPPGGYLGQDREAEALPRRGHQRRLPARDRHEGLRDHRGHQQGPRRPYLRDRRLRYRGRPLQGSAQADREDQGAEGRLRVVKA